MSDFTLSRESIEIIPNYNVIKSKFENLTEQTRLITPDMIVGYKIKTPAMTKADMQTYLSFFTGKYGTLTSFTFTCPFSDVEYTVRFKEGTFKITYASGYFQGEFEFERVF